MVLFKRGNELTLEAYTDADYAGLVDDRRSILSHCILLGGNPVTWRSTSQNVVAKSSVEAEFRPMVLGVFVLMVENNFRRSKDCMERTYEAILR